jgi:hypothetical protein
MQITGPSSTDSPYVVSTLVGVDIVSILTTGDQVGTKDGPAGFVGQPWRMVGIPDGLGAFDNGVGTMTVIMNQGTGGSTLSARTENMRSFN